MDKLILGVDAGNHMAKVMGPFGSDTFRTNICDWFERDVKEVFGSDDMEFEISNRKGYAGTIAMYEDEFGNGSIYGDTKAHDDTKIRVLLAINRYINKYCPMVERVAIVVGQPIIKHQDSEKNKIKEMLIGHHTIKVNGKTRTFFIENVGVAPEGSAAYWGRKTDGKLHIIDVGSSTVNAATIIDNRHINTASDTFNFGMETIKNKEDYKTVARHIIRNTTKLKWQKSDKVFICGGASEGIAPYIIEHYSNAELLLPQLPNGNSIQILSPTFANAVGFYVIGNGAFR